MALPPLISPEALEAAPGAVLIDLRLPADGGRVGYEDAHVPGAVFSDYAGDGWRVRIGNAPGMLPSAEHLAALLGRLGITPGRPVVLIPVGSSANDLAASARAYWTLKHAGHDAVSILDGGTKGWTASGRPAESGWIEPVAASAYPIVFRGGWRSDLAAARAALDARTATFLDGRSASYFAGAEKAGEARRAGHIPGAIHADYARLYDPARSGLRSYDELARLLASVPAGSVVSYCNTGHTAALNWFVLREIFGRGDVTLYDGSMTEWTQDEANPVVAL
ncbi:MAG TPA: rhodanese-like domain-containing protein [Rhabdaerophilum sp.]|nr:rhodanese-like domain-containing protein [Rhabdaerophilum sp.]